MQRTLKPARTETYDDHTDNDENFLIAGGATDERPSVAFIDHGYSMSCHDQFLDASSPFQPQRRGLIDVEKMPGTAITEMVRKLREIKPETIRTLVNRVSEVYLPLGLKEQIASSLIRRQAGLDELVVLHQGVQK